MKGIFGRCQRYVLHRALLSAILVLLYNASMLLYMPCIPTALFLLTMAPVLVDYSVEIPEMWMMVLWVKL